MSYQIRIDNELYEFAESQVENGETTGEAIRRILETHGAPIPSRKRRSLFAERRREIFRVPILSVLAEGNGEACVTDIKDKLLSKINTQLTDAERTGNKSARPAWWYDAEYERFEMIRDGLIDGTSPRGFWKLTQEGLKLAKSAAKGRRPMK
jgi:hypothetical protein